MRFAECDWFCKFWQQDLNSHRMFFLAGRVMNKLGFYLWYVFSSSCFTLPVVQAALKSLHQAHIRKVSSAVGCIRLRSLLAVMCKSENKLVGTIDH